MRRRQVPVGEGKRRRAISAKNRPRARPSETFGSNLASNRRTRVREDRRSSDNVRFPVSDGTIAEGRKRSINVYSACEIW
jgi:hypothetical protein